MWTETEPQVQQCLNNALIDSRHEVMIKNFAGIPILQQHGSADDNVPVFHARRMQQLIATENGANKVAYNECEGKGHWYDGVLSTEALRKFYHNVASSVEAPELPSHFKIIVPNPATMGSRAGLKIDMLLSPQRSGTLEVDRTRFVGRWTLCTSNISRFHFLDPPVTRNLPLVVSIDGQTFEFGRYSDLFGGTFVLNDQRLWDARPSSHF